MASAGEYSEDARRIERDYVSPDSTTQAEIRRDLKDADFAQAAIDKIVEGEDGGDGWLLDRDDIGIDEATAHTDGVTTREDVARAVEEADSVGYSESRLKSLTDRVSREVGAPSDSDLRSAQFGTLTESVVPSEVSSSTASTPVSIVRDTEGSVVGVVGSEKAGSAVAEEMGTEHLGNVNEYQENMTVEPAPGGSKGLMYSETPDGDLRPVGEVDL